MSACGARVVRWRETRGAQIGAFESGVRGLEKEMTDLSRAEAEAAGASGGRGGAVAVTHRAGTLDEEAKTELRENKMRLDREFGSMLIKIAVRARV